MRLSFGQQSIRYAIIFQYCDNEFYEHAMCVVDSTHQCQNLVEKFKSWEKMRNQQIIEPITPTQLWLSFPLQSHQTSSVLSSGWRVVVDLLHYFQTAENTVLFKVFTVFSFYFLLTMSLTRSITSRLCNSNYIRSSYSTSPLTQSSSFIYLLKSSSSFNSSASSRFFATVSAGIIGLPNVGKSTLFNALTQSQLAQASNYPFCTSKQETDKILNNDRCIKRHTVI